ncbi:hypothetical protein [Dyadobacter bucti]|uniref:hypothetical protein n=1 Tax=Dyadobacter bucti TaxID=2572203 RepID=UPI003F6F98F7
METTLNFNLHLTFKQLAELVRQLPRAEREKLVSVLQETTYDDQEPSKSKIFEDFKEDYVALQNGTLNTRPIKDILNEL